MAKKLLRNLIIIAALILSAHQILASDSFTPTEQLLSEIDSMITLCEQKGLSCDPQKANANIIRQFIIYGREDISKSNLVRGAYIQSKIFDLADKTKTEVSQILASNRGISVPVYDSGKIFTNGMNFQDINGRNQFFGGYLVFSNEHKQISNFKGFGNNFYSWEIGPRNTIVEEDTFLPSWTASVKQDITITTDDLVSVDGGRSVKFVCNTGLVDGYYAELKQTFLVKPNKIYQIEIWCKGEEAKGSVVYLNDQADKKTLPTGTYDWRKITYEVTTLSEQTGLTMRFIAQNLTKGLWIDNISVKEKGRDFSYINNGDFETVWGNGEFLVNQGTMNYIKAIMEEAEEQGISVMLLLSPHYVPDWVWTKYPEAYGYQEGFLRGNVTNATYRRLIKTHVQAATAAVAAYPNLHSLVLTNEPMYNTIYYTNGAQTFKADFIQYLREKYNDPSSAFVPAQMRKNWGITNTTYLWSSVSMPAANTISANGRFWDWMEYNNKVFGEFHQWMADSVHEIDSDIPVHAKLYDTTFKRSKLDKGTDAETLYAYLDYNGFDGGMNYQSDRKELLHIRMAEDLANSVSDTPTVNSENHIIPDDCIDYSGQHALIAGADLWQGFIHGRTASSTWVWRRHDTYKEYRNSLAYRPDIVANISEKTMNANRFAGELAKLQYTEKRFYILYSTAALLYNEQAYLSAVSNAYEALWSLGQKAAFVTEKQIAVGKLDSDAVLIIPSTANINDAAIWGLNNFTGKTVSIGNLPAKNQYDLSISLNLRNKISVADSLLVLQNTFEGILNERNVPVITFRDAEGRLLEMTDIRATVDNDHVLINACNNTWNELENVSVYYGGQKLSGGYDVIHDLEIQNNLTLLPFEPVLLKFYDEELFDNGDISDVQVIPYNRGALIRWQKGIGVVTVHHDQHLLGSVMANNGYIYLDGLENGITYQLTLTCGDVQLELFATPAAEAVSVYDGGVGENGYMYRVQNNTNMEIPFDFKTEHMNIRFFLPAWGEKQLQVSERYPDAEEIPAE